MRFKSLLVAAVIPVALIAAARPSQEQQVHLDPVLLSYVHARTSIDPSHESRVVRDDQLQRRVALLYFWAGYHRNLIVAAAELNRRAEAHRQEVRQRHKSPSAHHPDGGAVGPVYGSGRCGGDLPDCYIMMRESGGSLTAKNPNSSASGKWQFIDSTWDNFMGYAHASDAPEWVQDERARQVWAGGAGASNWACC